MQRFVRDCFVISALWLFWAVSLSFAQQPVFEEIRVIKDAENIIAVDNVCAWPNLTLMPDGSVTALIFNRQSKPRLSSLQLR